MPEESWQDASSGDLLAMIDEDLAGNRVTQAGAGDLAQQQLMDEMVRTEELLNALGVDLETTTNEEVRALVEDASLYQREKPKDYADLDAKTKAIVDEALADSAEGDAIRERLIELAGTPWASQAIDGAKARVAMKRLMAGKEPDFESSLDSPQAVQMRAALKKGPEGVATYLQAKSILGHPGKPVNAVNSSFLNCEPSANCAKYCYATKGNYLYDVNVNKGELVSYFVENFPKEAAELAAAQYKAMPEYAAGKALRLFDKGDGSAAWLPYIKEMNRRGVRLHIFSKRPEFLRQVPEGNVRLLSIDESNLEMADQNPDLQIAFVYQGTDAEVTWMEERADRMQLILPIMGERGEAARARKQEMVAKIPKKLRVNKCPIDAEVKTITSGKVKWDCTRCDAGGGVGCYNKQTTKMVGNSITVPFPQMAEKNATKQTLNELQEVADALPGPERESLLEELGQLISAARAGIDLERETDGEGVANRTATKAEEGARAVGPLGNGELKRLYQIIGFHGTGEGGIQRFLDELIGTANGLAYGYGHYIATKEEVAESFMRLAESGGDLMDRIIAAASPHMEGELDVLLGEGKGFMAIDWLGEALAETRGDVAATIAYAEQKREQWLDLDEPMAAGLWNDIANLLTRWPETVQPMVDMADVQLDPGVVRARIDRLPGEFLDWQAPLPADKLELAKAQAERNGSTELLTELQKIGEQDWTGEIFYQWLAGYFGDSQQAASEFLGSAGIPGNTYMGYEGLEMGAPRERTYVVFSGKDIVVEDRLYQENMKRPRGYITFDETRAWFKITLTERANLSTFLHESGHFFLESLRRMGQSPNAPLDVQKDLATIYDWLGVEQGVPLTREQHEKFARAFEQYLGNGEAPSEALRDPFRKFRDWIISIYRRLSALDVDMTPEVRGVMDRLVATKEQIAEAKEGAGYTEPIFSTAEEAGMSEVDFAAYHRLYARGLQAAEEELAVRSVQEQARVHKAEYKARRKEVKEEVDAEIAQDPAQQAKYLLRTGKMLDGSEVPDHLKGLKLHSNSLLETYPNVKILRRLPGMYRKDGTNPDLVAGYFGFDSGDALVQAILASPKRQELSQQRTDARMLEEYPDSSVDGTLPAKALAAMHNQDTARFLLAELRLLAKRAGKDEATPLSIIKEAAQQRVDNMRLQDLTPGRYRAAEQREANRAIKAAAKQDFVTAADAKRKQLLNHWMYRYTVAAREKGTKQRDYLKKFDDGKLRRRWAMGGIQSYLDAIDTYLEGISLRKTSLKRQAALKDLAAWLKRREEADEAVQIPEKLRHEANLTNWRQMTVTQMDELVNAVKNIEHLAKLKGKLVAGKKARDFAEAKDALIAQIYTTQPEKVKAKTQNPRLLQRVLDPVTQFQAELTKPEFIARWIDGETAGTAHELFFQPFVDAQIDKLDMEVALGKQLEAVFKGMTPAQKAKMGRSYDIFGVETKGEEVLAIALNLGNEGNTRKLLEGERRGWTEETLRARLDEILTVEDWRMVQAIWDTVDQFWPRIEALHKEMTGVAPPRVEAKSFTVQGESFRGGYYPVIYDPDKTPRHFKMAEQKAAEGLFQNNFMRPNVSKGFTEARKANYSRPLLLTLNALPAHLSEVIHYLSHYKAVTEVHKLMNHPEVQEALIATFGKHVQRQFLPWLQAIAQSSTVPDATTKIDSVWRYSRHATSVIAMGFKFSTAMMQAFGLFTTVDQIGMKYSLLGLAEAAKQLGAGTRTFEDINKKSGEVRHAMRTFDRDARQIIDRTFGERGAARQWNKVQGFTFVLMGTMQKMVNMATWYGAYRKAIDEGKTARRATNIADASVRQSQSGGGVKDLAAIQRGGEATQLMTLFYTYFSVLHNRLTETGRQAMGKQRVKDSPVVAARLAWLILLPVITEAIMRGREPEDEEARAQWWLKQFVLYGLVTVPVVRDIASGVMGEYGYTFTPVAGTIEKIVRGLGGIGDAIDPNEEMTEAEVKGLLNAAGFAAKLPAGQLWVLYKWFQGFNEGTLEEPIRELIYQRREQ